jgi:RNA polymerase primary sigma factor
MSPAAIQRVISKVEPEIIATVSSNGEIKPMEAAASKGSSKAAAATKSSTTKAAKSAAAKGAPKSKAAPAADEAAKLEDAADALLAGSEVDTDFDDSDALLLEADDKLSKDDKKDAKAKALASIKVGPKGVYTEDSIRVYLQEIGRIRLLRPDEEIELARKIADLLQLEELATQFESDKGHYPDTKEWAALRLKSLITRRVTSSPPMPLGGSARPSPEPSPIRAAPSVCRCTFTKPSLASRKPPRPYPRSSGANPRKRRSPRAWR